MKVTFTEEILTFNDFVSSLSTEGRSFFAEYTLNSEGDVYMINLSIYNGGECVAEATIEEYGPDTYCLGECNNWDVPEVSEANFDFSGSFTSAQLTTLLSEMIKYLP